MIGMVTDALGLLLIISGALFFAAGTVALIRFQGVRSRLHALTKADNLGLGSSWPAPPCCWGPGPPPGSCC